MGAGGKHSLSAAVVENKGERGPTVPRTEKTKNKTDGVVGFSPIAASLRAIKDAGRGGNRKSTPPGSRGTTLLSLRHRHPGSPIGSMTKTWIIRRAEARSMKDEAGQQQAPHDGQQTFKDCGTLILIEIPFVAFGGGAYI